MLVIVGVGAVINQALYGTSLGSTGWLTANAPLAPTRVDVLTGQSGWGLPVVVIVTAAAAMIFVVTHWYRFHRLINRGETFIVRHPWFDIALVVILTAGVILTRSA